MDADHAGCDCRRRCGEIGIDEIHAGVPVAAGILYPLTDALLSPAFAALAMSLSSVSVIGNALRLRRINLID